MKLATLTAKNNTLKRNIETYKSMIDSANKAESEFRKEIEAARCLKNKYNEALQEIHKLKARYESEMTDLMNLFKA